MSIRAAFLVFVAASLLCGQWMWEQRTGAVRAANIAAQAPNASPPSSASTAPPKASTESVSAIEKSCGEIFVRDKINPPDISIGRDDPEGGSPGAWQTFQSPTDLEKVAKYANFEDQAWVWKGDGNIVHAKITLPTEGWTTVADYCFQAEIDRREWMFDSKGRIQNMKQQFLDLDTGKPKKPERDFTDVDTTIYFNVKDLPFASLLQKAGAQP